MSVPARVAVQDAPSRAPASARPIRIALLGHGVVGAEVAKAAAEWSAPERRLEIAGALVRNPHRTDRVASAFGFVDRIEPLLESAPDVIVEVLGGLEPARSFVRAALERAVPVVTANKALIARHGDELLEMARRHRVPFRYEASVLAGVPFLGTFAARPYAARVARLAGIVNGTSNYVLSRIAAGAPFADAVADAVRLGYAEPDASGDLDGLDAAHKLAVLTRHFGVGSVDVDEVETTGIRELCASDFAAARELGGTIKPVVAASSHGERIEAFVGPAFVPATHKLAAIEGVENALALDAPPGPLFLSGPGAGPRATATSILDDVVEAVGGRTGTGCSATARRLLGAPSTRWFLRLASPGAPRGSDVVKLLASYGVWPGASVSRDRATWSLTYECSRARVDRALAALAQAGIRGLAIRALA